MKYHAATAVATAYCTSVAHAADPSPVASAGSIVQVLLGLILVLGLMAALAWALKRLSANRPTGSAAIRIVGGVSVGTRERILVVEAADQWIIVGVAPGRVNALSTMPRQETAAVATSIPAATNFSSWLKQALGKNNA